VEQDPQSRRHIPWTQWKQNPEECKADVLIQNTVIDKFGSDQDEKDAQNIQAVFQNSGYDLKNPQPFEQSKVEATITANSWFDFAPIRAKYDEWCQKNSQ
jgi:hypothetical protein